MADDDSNPINQVDFADGPGATEQPPQPQQRNGAVSAAMLDPSAPVIMEGQPNTQTRYFLNISSCGIGGTYVGDLRLHSFTHSLYHSLQANDCTKLFNTTMANSNR